jgi:PAS domain S-box-containing protein
MDTLPVNPTFVEPPAQPRSWKLRNQLAVSLCLLCVLATGVFSLWHYTQQRQALLAGIDNQLRTAALMARGLVSEDYHDQITGPQSVSDADFQRLVDRYNRLCKALEMEYLWSLMVVSNRIVFTTSTSPDKIVTNRQHAAFFEAHSNPELYQQTFASMTPTYQDNVDKWGRIRVALLPFKDQQGRPHLFGASVRLAEVDRRLRHTIYECVLGGLLLLGSGLATSVLLSRLVTRPLHRLTNTIEQIGAGHLGLVAEERGSHEIRVLAASFNRLNRALLDKIAALSRQEEHERITLQSIGDAVLATDSAGRITRLNPTAERLTGWPLAEALGRPLVEVFHIINAATREPVANPVQQVLARGEVVGLANHTALLARDGQEYQIADSAAPIRDRAGKIVGVVLVFSDVTERYRAQQALRDSEHSLQQAQRLAGLGNYSMDVITGSWTSSPILDQIFGVDETCERSVATWVTLLHPDNRSAMVDYFTNQVVGQGRAFDREYRIVRRSDRSERWVHGLGKLEFDAQGQPVKMHGTIQDITERKLAALALAESEEKFSKVFRDAPVWIAITDVETGVYVDVNEQALRETGYLREEVIGHTAAAIGWISAEERARLVREVRTYGRIVGLEMTFHAKNGRPLDGLVCGEIVAIGGRPCLLTITLDITARKLAEAKLRESEEKFSKVFHDAPVWIAITDVETAVFLDVNEQALRDSGFTRDEVIGHTSVGIGLVSAEDRVRTVREVRERGRVASMEMVFHAKDGRRMEGLVCGELLTIGGRPCLLTVILDITKRRQTENALRENRAMLQQILDTVPQAIFWKDQASVYLGCNRVFAQAVNLSDPEQIAGKTDFDLPWSPAEAEAYRADDAKVIASGTPKRHILEPLRQADGSRLWIDTTKLPLRDAHGNVHGILGVYDDITERRRAEELVRASEARLQAIIEAMPMPMAVNDENQNITFVNRSFVATFGYTLADIPTVAVWWPLAYPDPVYRQQVTQEWYVAAEKAQREGTSVELPDYQVVGKNGMVRDIHFTTAPMGTSQLVIFYDMTERRRAEAELEKARGLLAAAVEQSPAGILVADAPDVRIRLANSAALGIRGGAPSSLVNIPAALHPQNWQTFHLDGTPVAPEDLPLSRAVLAGVVSRNVEVIIRRPDGENRWVLANAAPVRNASGVLVAGVVVFLDVTERRQAEAALRESEERYRTLFDRANDGIFLLTTDGQLVGVNKAFAEMHGYGAEELLRRHLREFDTPETARLIPERMSRLLAGESLTFEVEHYHRNGHVFPLEVSASLVSLDGKPFIQCFHRDITERKRNEAALRTALRDKEALLKEVHHRVKNNLQVITSLLRLEAVRSEHLLTKAVLKDMQGRIRAMALLHESLYRSGQFAQVDLAAYLRQVTSKLFRALALEPDTIRFHLELAPVWLALDQAVPCGLIVNELISNCLKHGFPDGRRGEIRIALQTMDDGTRIQLRVSDNGVGLPEDFATRKGHSLGLQLVHDLARQLQGRLDIGPSAGSGAVFAITFPPLPTVAMPALPEAMPDTD